MLSSIIFTIICFFLHFMPLQYWFLCNINKCWPHKLIKSCGSVSLTNCQKEKFVMFWVGLGRPISHRNKPANFKQHWYHSQVETAQKILQVKVFLCVCRVLNPTVKVILSVKELFKHQVLVFTRNSNIWQTSHLSFSQVCKLFSSWFVFPA